MTTVVNFFGGPGSGKSKIAARLFSDLKEMNIGCELITEYAKRKTWEGNYGALSNQLYIFAKQQYHMWTVAKHVELMVTDSPLILGTLYGGDELLNQLVHREFNQYNNINIFLERICKYDPIGRNQSEDEAKELDTKCLELLYMNKYEYKVFDGSLSSINDIKKYILTKLIKHD